MLNVCFGDSECGALRQALGSKEDVSFGYPLLNLGHIDNEHFDEARREWIDKFFSVCPKSERTRIWKEERKRVDGILERAKHGEAIRIWFADNPCSKCGYYQLVDALQGVKCDIYVVEMPKNLSFRDADGDKSWGEVPPRDMTRCLDLQKKLTVEDRNEISKTWQKLAREDSALRVNINGKVTSVSEDYLDEEILSYAQKNEPFKFVTLVGYAIGNSKHCLPDAFVADRIEHLIVKGALVVVERLENSENTNPCYPNVMLRVSTK